MDTFLNLLTELWLLEAGREAGGLAGWGARLRHTGNPMADIRVLVTPTRSESRHEEEGREVRRQPPGARGTPNLASPGLGTNMATGTHSPGSRLHRTHQTCPGQNQ